MRGHPQREGRRETRNENYRVEREGDPFGHAPAFAESLSPARVAFRRVLDRAERPATGAPSSDTRVRFSCAETGGKTWSICVTKLQMFQTLRPIYKYVCYFARLHSPGCRAASNPMGGGVFVRARRDPCAQHEPRSLVASIVQVYSLSNNFEMIKSEKLNLILLVLIFSTCNRY